MSKAKMFDWVINETKYMQAVDFLKTNGIDLTEENIKKEYVKRAGLLREKHAAEGSDEESSKKPTRRSSKKSEKESEESEIVSEE